MGCFNYVCLYKHTYIAFIFISRHKNIKILVWDGKILNISF